MKRTQILLSWIGGLVAAACAWATPPAPTLIATYMLPPSVAGHFDHFGIDSRRGLVFVAAESAHKVLVLSARDGKLVHTIDNVRIPHSILVRHRLGRFFVTDGGAGELRIYNERTFRQIGGVKLQRDADSIGYDPISHDLYIVNGGYDAGENFAYVSEVNTDTDREIAKVRVEGGGVEQIAVDHPAGRVFVANPSRGAIDVIGARTHRLLARWPIAMGRHCVSPATDPESHRLFVGCRSGVIVVMNSRTGRELRTLRIAPGIDDIVFNPAARALYASCGGDGGHLFIWRELGADRYRQAADLPTAAWAKNEIYDAIHGRLYTLAPEPRPRVLVYRVGR